MIIIFTVDKEVEDGDLFFHTFINTHNDNKNKEEEESFDERK